MDSTSVGILFLLVGILLLPFGIKFFMEAWKEYKELSWKKKILIFFLEIIDVSTTQLLWVLYISILLILFGIVLIVFV